MKINDPTVHINMCHKLTCMEGLRQVVIGPSDEPFDYLFFVGVGGEQNGMRLEPWKSRHMSLRCSRPPMSGMYQSLMTTASSCSANRSRASWPFFANNTLYSSPEKDARSVCEKRQIIDRQGLEWL
jgi:hypothetical protein